MKNYGLYVEASYLIDEHDKIRPGSVRKGLLAFCGEQKVYGTVIFDTGRRKYETARGGRQPLKHVFSNKIIARVYYKRWYKIYGYIWKIIKWKVVKLKEVNDCVEIQAN